jgi:hypothetical protein
MLAMNTLCNRRTIFLINIFMKYLFFLLFPFQLFAQKSTLLIRQVNIIDIQTGKVLTSQNVLISGNRIERITSEPIASKDATIINGSGKFLIPGMWDMHVHVFNNISDRAPNEYYHPLFIANGVTSIREMWTKPKNMHYITRWRDSLKIQTSHLPRYISVGTLVDGVPRVWPNSDTVRNAEEAREMVRTVKKGNLDFFKVYSNLSRDAYFAIADECKKLNFPFAGHVPNGISMAEAASAGQKSQEHVGYWAMFTELSDKEEKFKNIKPADFTPALRKELLESISEKKAAELAAVFVKNGTAFCPTLVQFRGATIADDKEVQEDERLQYVDSFDKNDWADIPGGYRQPISFREMRYQKGLDVVRILHKYGVQILAGTDLGNPFVYAGFSLHDELSLLVKAGLSPLAALQTATINPATYVGKQNELGTVTQGKIADLIILDDNPLSNILNTKKINSVILNGQFLKREDLDKLLEKGKENIRRFENLEKK